MNAVKGGALSLEQAGANIAASRESKTYTSEQANQQKAETFVQNMMTQMYDPMRDDLQSMQEKTMLAYDTAERKVAEQISQLQFQIQQSKGETKKSYEKAMADLLQQQAYLQDQMQSQQLGLQRSYEDSMATMQRDLAEYQNQTLANLQSRGILRSGITGGLFNRIQSDYGQEVSRLGLERGRGMEEIGRAFGLGLSEIAGSYGDLQSGMASALAGINQQGILSTGQLMGQYGDIGAQRAQSWEDYNRQLQTLGRSRAANYQTAMMDYMDRLRNFGLQAEQLDVGQSQWQQEFAEQKRQFEANLALQREAMRGYGGGGYGGGGYGGGAGTTGYEDVGQGALNEYGPDIYQSNAGWITSMFPSVGGWDTGQLLGTGASAPGGIAPTAPATPALSGWGSNYAQQTAQRQGVYKPPQYTWGVNPISIY